MNRRVFLQAVGVTGAVSLAGCGGLFETRSIRAPALVENRPDAVYYPTHVEEMEMVGMQTAGRYACALSYSFPHRFWLMDGNEPNLVSIDTDDSLHLMASLWDQETKTVLIGGNASFSIEQDGETVAERPPWPMLSQNMGVHFGDNYVLPDDGTYEVLVDVGPVGTRTTGSLTGAFGGRESLTFELSFSQSTVQELDFQRLDDREGTAGAVEPMEMGMMPTATVPRGDDLDGDVIGEGTSGDGRFVVIHRTNVPSGLETDGPYLAVLAHTPYNRYPLPMMALSAQVDRDGSTIFDESLTATLDPELGYHYGALVDSIEAGDELTISPGAPPQIARHEGYETAFLDMEDISMTVSP